MVTFPSLPLARAIRPASRRSPSRSPAPGVARPSDVPRDPCPPLQGTWAPFGCPRPPTLPGVRALPASGRELLPRPPRAFLGPAPYALPVGQGISAPPFGRAASALAFRGAQPSRSVRGPRPSPSARGAQPSPSAGGPQLPRSEGLRRGLPLSRSARAPQPSPSVRGPQPSPSARGSGGAGRRTRSGFFFTGRAGMPRWRWSGSVSLVVTARAPTMEFRAMRAPARTVAW